VVVPPAAGVVAQLAAGAAVCGWLVGSCAAGWGAAELDGTLVGLDLVSDLDPDPDPVSYPRGRSFISADWSE